MTYFFELSGFKETVGILPKFCRLNFLEHSFFSGLKCFSSFIGIKERLEKKT